MNKCKFVNSCECVILKITVYTKVTVTNKVFFLSWLGLVLLHYNKEKIKQLT
jgi:hypothetical protein